MNIIKHRVDQLNRKSISVPMRETRHSTKFGTTFDTVYIQIFFFGRTGVIWYPRVTHVFREIKRTITDMSVRQEMPTLVSAKLIVD